MFHAKALVIELAAKDGLAASAIPVTEITPLQHKPRDDAMENGSFIVQQLLSGFSDPLLTST